MARAARVDFSKVKDFPVVEIEWVDSYTSHRWQKLDDHIAPRDAAAACKSVGYLVQQTRDFVRFTGSLSGDDWYDCTQHIPRSAIRRLRTLRR